VREFEELLGRQPLGPLIGPMTYGEKASTCPLADFLRRTWSQRE
jgi:hypothetical protein